MRSVGSVVDHNHSPPGQGEHGDLFISGRYDEPGSHTCLWRNQVDTCSCRYRRQIPYRDTTETFKQTRTLLYKSLLHLAKHEMDKYLSKEIENVYILWGIPRQEHPLPLNSRINTSSCTIVNKALTAASNKYMHLRHHQQLLQQQQLLQH